MTSHPRAAAPGRRTRWSVRLWRLGLVLAFLAPAACAQGPSSHQAYLERELRFLRLGVDLETEERAVRQVLAQRKLSVVGQVRGPGFIALSAQSFDGRLSAVRVITGRGVVLAEDGDEEDLFVPSSLHLLRGMPTSVGEHTLVAWVRTARGHDLGCATLLRVLPDGNTVAGVLDTSTFGPRACVSDLTRVDNGPLSAQVAFPGLMSERTPFIQAEMAFQEVPLGRPAPIVPVAKIRSQGSWLEAERAYWQASLPASAPVTDRHAVGVSLAAIAVLSGQDKDAQIAAYRQVIGRVALGSRDANLVAETLSYMRRGWLNEGDPRDGVGADEQVIEEALEDGAELPGELPEELPEDVEIIEPASL